MGSRFRQLNTDNADINEEKTKKKQENNEKQNERNKDRIYTENKYEKQQFITTAKIVIY